MALHGEEGSFDALYQSLQISHGLGSNIDDYIAFQNIVTGTVPAA